MLSPESQILIKLQIRWASFVGGIPCKLDGNSPRFLWTHYHWKKFLVHTLFHWIYSFYLVARIIFIDKHTDRRFYYICSGALLLHVFLSSFGIFVIFENWKNKVASFNVGYDFWMYFNGKYRETRVYDNNHHAYEEKICGLMSLSCFGFGPLLIGLLRLQFSKSPYFIYTLLPESFIGIWITLPVDLILLWMLWSGFSLVAVVGHLALMNTISAIRIVSNELQPNKSSYLTEEDLRTPKNLRHVYRSLQLILQCYQKSFGHWLLPLQFILTRGIILCTFILVRYFRQINLRIKLFLSLVSMFCLLWAVVIYMGGKMAVCSKQCLKSWKEFRWSGKCSSEIVDIKSMAKFRKSCTLLRFKMGSFYFLGRSSCLKFIKDASLGSGKALLAIAK